MQKYPVTIQEMDRVAKSIGVIHYNDDAMKKVCLIVRLGFDATAEMYAAELKITLRKDEHPADVAQQIERGIDAELGTHVIISGGEVLELSASQPKDDTIPF